MENAVVVLNQSDLRGLIKEELKDTLSELTQSIVALAGKIGIPMQKEEDVKMSREETYRRDKLRLENVNAGLLDEQERRNAVAKLEREKRDLLKQIEQAVALGDTDEADKLKAQLEKTEEILKEKGDVMKQLAEGLGGAVSDSLTSMFAGDEEDAIDSMRAYFARLAGELKGLLSAFVLKMVLSKGTTDYLALLPFPFNIAAIPVVTGLVNAGVSAIADPIINELLSFSTGGRLPVGVYDKPTGIIVGDAAKLGGANTETVLRDEHIIGLVKMASGGGNAAMVSEISAMRRDIANLKIEFQLKGQDINGSLSRTKYANSNRAR
jgi:hypothetical protein